jgi:hypothetical protein
MTTKEIADFCEVSTRTIRRWVDKMSGGAGHNGVSIITAEKIKMLEAGESGKSVDWTEAEFFQILQAGGRGAVVQWIKEAKSQEISSQIKAAQASKVSGALVNAMFKMYGPVEGQRRIDYMLGITAPVPAAVKPVLQIEEKPQALPPQVARQVYAVAIKAMNKVLAENTAKAQTPELF